MQKVRQHCIEAHYFDELLDQVPPEVVIESVAWEVGSHHQKHTLPVPKKLAKKGVGHMRILHETVNVEGNFRNETRANMCKLLDDICKETGHRRGRVRVRRCVLKYKGELAQFARTIKHIAPTATEPGNKRLRVLGLQTPMKDATNLLAALGGAEYVCTFGTVEVTQSVCSKA